MRRNKQGWGWTEGRKKVTFFLLFLSLNPTQITVIIFYPLITLTRQRKEMEDAMTGLNEEEKWKGSHRNERQEQGLRIVLWIQKWVGSEWVSTRIKMEKEANECRERKVRITHHHHLYFDEKFQGLKLRITCETTETISTWFIIKIFKRTELLRKRGMEFPSNWNVHRLKVRLFISSKVGERNVRYRHRITIWREPELMRVGDSPTRRDKKKKMLKPTLEEKIRQWKWRVKNDF